MHNVAWIYGHKFTDAHFKSQPNLSFLYHHVIIIGFLYLLSMS